MTATSILVIALPLIVIVGSAWSLICDRSKPFRRHDVDVAEQILQTDFASIESWILANGDFETTIEQVVLGEAQNMARSK